MSQRAYSRRKAKGFFAEMQQVILHPLAFFAALPEQAESRTWLMAAFLILGLVGYSAVQQMAALPEDFGTTANPVQQQVITGLMAASGLIIVWIAQALLLLPLAVISKKAPKFSLNLHIAIWSSLPFALLSLIQIAYLWAGGPIGGTGLAPLLSSLLPFEMQGTGLSILLLNLAKHMTLFSFWNLALLSLGARYSLKAQWGVTLIFLLLWIILVLLVPTILDSLSAPQF